ncbi:MAG TPA: hypothetical protein VKG45_15385 [Actinomycetes bacterium]|nr:hypothetical protein [Actinomycetes bacterium]
MHRRRPATFQIGTQRGPLPLVLALARAVALTGGTATLRGPGGAVTVTHTAGRFTVEPASLLTPDWIQQARSILADHAQETP